MPVKDKSAFYMGAFHPKLWLLKFDSFLRIVISSANLTLKDFSHWSNGFWV
jgi:tyrosyl-DNA phosphodiesterase-1